MDPSELKTLVDDLHGQGQEDSTGKFTLAQDKALEKLSKFQLTQPRYYVLNLVAVAVLGGAPEIEVESKAARMSFTFDGEPLPDEAFQNLPNQILNPTEIRLQELAVALNAAKSLDPRNLFLLSWDGEQGTRFDALTNQVESLQEPPEGISGPATRITVELGRREMALRYLTSERVERTALRRAELAPSLVRFNGANISREIGFSESLACLHLTPAEPSLRLRAPSQGFQMEATTQNGLEGVLTLEHPMNVKGLTLLCRGVSFEMAQEFSLPFVNAVVAAPGLSKNVSHSDIVRNSAYQELVADLNLRMDQLLLAWLASEEPVPAGFRNQIEWQLPGLRHRLWQREDSEGLKTLERWTLELKFLRDLENKRLFQEMLLEAKEDSGLAGRLRKTLVRAVISELESCRAAPAAQMVERLVEVGETLQAEWFYQARELGGLIRALSGQRVGRFLPETEIGKELVARLQQRFDECSRVEDPLFQGELALARADFEPAEQFLRSACEAEFTPTAAEALSDLLAFRREQRAEAFDWRRRAFEHRNQNPDFGGKAFYSDLLQVGKGAIGFKKWVRTRVHQGLAVTGTKKLRTVENDLDSADEFFGENARVAIARVKGVAVWAEAALGHGHEFLDAARSRAAHILRKNGFWAEADEPIVRGHLFKLAMERARELSSVDRPRTAQAQPASL